MKTYLFSNVVRDGFDPSSLNGRFVFLNKAVPYFRARPFFFGRDVRFFFRNSNEADPSCRDFFGERDVCGAGVVAPMFHVELRDGVCCSVRGDGRTECLDVSDYTPGKVPTTGYLVSRCLRQMGEDVVLVNFYGTRDSSTPHWSKHDWEFEERMFSSEPSLFV